MPDLLSTILGLGKKTEEIKEIYIDDIIPNPSQPRDVFEKEPLEELAKSIEQFGVIQPIIVRRKGAKYELVCGERRLRASKMANMDKIPAIIRRLSDEESMEFCLIENLQRKDLNPIEEAKVYLKLVRELKLTQKEVAEKVGKSPLFITNMMKLLRLPQEIKENVSRETISKGHCFELLRLSEKDQQIKVLYEIKENHLSVKQTAKLVDKILKEGKKKIEKSSKKIEFTKEFREQLTTFQKILNIIKRKNKPLEWTKTETEEYTEIKIIIPKKVKSAKQQNITDESAEKPSTSDNLPDYQVENVEIKEVEDVTKEKDILQNKTDSPAVSESEVLL